MISIKGNNDNQSEKNSKLIAQNNMVSTDSKAKKLVDVKGEEEDEDVYLKTSNNSKTINYRLPEADKAPDDEHTDKPEGKALQGKMYKKLVKEKNSAQFEQNFSADTPITNDDVYPTAMPTRKINYDEVNPTITYTSSENTAPEQRFSAGYIQGGNAITTPRNKSYSRRIKKYALRKSVKPLERSYKNNNYELTEAAAGVTAVNKKVSLDENIGKNLSAKNISKVDKNKVFSSNALSEAPPEKQFTNQRFKKLIKKRSFKSDNNASAYSLATETFIQQNLSNQTSSASFKSNLYDVSFGHSLDNAGVKYMPQNGYIKPEPAIGVESNSTKTFTNSRYKVKIRRHSFDEQRISPTSRNIPADGTQGLNKQNENITKVKEAKQTEYQQTPQRSADFARGSKKTPDKKAPPSMKSQFSENCHTLFSDTKKVVANGGKAGLYTIGLSVATNASQNSAEGQAVNVPFIVVETAKDVKAGYQTAVGAAKGAAFAASTPFNITRSTYRAAKKGYNLAKTSKALLHKAKNMGKKQLMQKAQAKIKQVAMAKLNTVRQILVKRAAALALAALSAMSVFLLFFLLGGGLLVILFSSFSWQTSKDIDTTHLISYISELDLAVQDYVRDNTKTTEQDDAETEDVYYYYYAYDKPDASYEYGTDGRPINIRGYISAGHYDNMIDELKFFSTKDYVSALSYLQVKYGNLAWYQTIVGAIGDAILRGYAKDLHDLTHSVVTESYTSSDGTTTYHYYFYKQYSIDYLVENGILGLTESEKETYQYTCAYGNVNLAVLDYPLHSDIDIITPYGYRVDPDGGQIFHSGVDLACVSGEEIYAPQSGYLFIQDTAATEGIKVRIYNRDPSTVGNDLKWTEISMLSSCVFSNDIVDGVMSYPYVEAGELIGYAGSSEDYTNNAAECIQEENHIHLEYYTHDDNGDLITMAPETLFSYDE